DRTDLAHGSLTAPRSNLAAPRASAGFSGTLGNTEAMQLLRDFGIPLAETIAAKDAGAAVAAADRLGYPVALKIDSRQIAHKTDVGGIRVGCGAAAAVRAAFAEMLDEVRRRAPAARLDGALVQRMITGGREMILGVKTDPLFGPAVVCGFGGIFVEQLRDVSLRVPPIGPADAAAMIAELRGAVILAGARGRAPADTRALADAEVRAIILTGAGRGFSAGFDIARRPDGKSSLDATGVEVAEYIKRWWARDRDSVTELMHLWHLTKPVIAAVHGWVMGGGFWY